MNPFMKKIICVMTAVLMAAVPVEAMAAEPYSSAEICGFYSPMDYVIHSVPESVTASKVEERLAKLRSLGGSYFTVNGRACVEAPGEWGHGCDNCKSTNLIETKLLDLMPASRDCLPGYYLSGGSISNICWSCAAFATIAHWYLYAGKETDAVRVNKIASGNFNAETLASAKPGDIIALSSVSTGRHYHSMIFIGHVAGGIKVIDCNWSNQTYGNCYVMERTMSYSSSYTVAISRASNYEEEKAAVTGIEIVNPENGEAIESIELEKKGSVQLAAEIYPEDAFDRGIIWSSSDTSVAEVSAEGLVTAIGTGKAEITATASGGDFSDSCTVEVIKTTYTVSYDANGGENAPESQIKPEDETIVLCAEEPVRKGCIFIGWAKEPDADTAEYLPGDEYSANESIVLYAVWERDTEGIIYGDINGDGRINIADANLVRRCAAKLITLDEKQMTAADVNGDGRVNIADANLIRRYAAKLITDFPTEG